MQWDQIVMFVHIPLVLVLVFVFGYLMKRLGILLPQRDMDLVQKAVDLGIQYAEQVAGVRKKINTKMTSVEKLSLAKTLCEQLLDMFKIPQYKPLIVGMIEATLFDIEQNNDEMPDGV